jgi:hypothetical protein
MVAISRFCELPWQAPSATDVASANEDQRKKPPEWSFVFSMSAEQNGHRVSASNTCRAHSVQGEKTCWDIALYLAIG